MLRVDRKDFGWGHSWESTGAQTEDLGGRLSSPEFAGYRDGQSEASIVMVRGR